jgi:hypothetical protein
MANLSTQTRTELAYRSGAGIEVTLIWVHGEDEDKALVCVCDRREGAYFEIPAEAHLALDVYYHPFVYRDFSTVDFDDRRLAA